MKRIILLLFMIFCALLKVEAQVENSPIEEIADSLNVLIEENVIVFKDTRLDILDSRAAIMSSIDERVREREKQNEIPLYKPIVSSDGRKKVTGSIYTAKGFRIIIYNGPDRSAALTAKNNFARAFPSTPSILSYNVPSYKIKVGNFENRKDASSFLRKVNKAFPTAFIVPDIITIKNINVSK